jgi:copper chaperone CopZ
MLCSRTGVEKRAMSDAHLDQLLLIKIDGMHCHKCQEKIKHSMQLIPGVHEVEVDFPSRQASVIFNPEQVKVRNLIDAVAELGYRAASFTTQTANAQLPRPPTRNPDATP